MNHQCPRCGFKTTKLSSFKNHLNRAFMCLPKKTSDSLEEIKKKYGVIKESNKFTCETCCKEYATLKGFNNHKKSCIALDKDIVYNNIVLDKISNSMSNIERGIDTLTECMNIQITQMTRMINAIDKLSNVTTISSTSVINPDPPPVIKKDTCVENVPILQPIAAKATPRVFVKDFGQEEIRHLYNNEVFMQNVFQQSEKGIFKFIDFVWFDTNHPKNMNIRITNTDLCEYYRGGRWFKEDLTKLSLTILDYVGSYFQEFLECKDNVLTHAFLDSYMTKIGIPLEWDLSHKDYDPEFERDMQDDIQKRDIQKALASYLLKKAS